MSSPRAPLVLGWREEAAFPDWGLARLKVKLDTGARTSAVHARRVIEVGQHVRDGQSLPVLELELPLDREPDGASTLVRAASLGTRTVRDTRDRPEERHVIATRLVLGPVEKEIHISVTDRAGIDLHTASNHRTNVPQLRVHLDDPVTRHLAEALGAPFIIDAARRTGSLRDAARLAGVPMLTYEGGQALRFDADAIAVGLAGVLRVLQVLGMRDERVAEPISAALVSRETHWVRAEAGGILDLDVGPGDLVEEGQQLYSVTGPFGRERVAQSSPADGAVIGLTTLPLVNPGDAVVHVAVRRDSWDLSRPAELDEPTDEEDVDEDEDDREHEDEDDGAPAQ